MARKHIATFRFPSQADRHFATSRFPQADRRSGLDHLDLDSPGSPAGEMAAGGAGPEGGELALALHREDLQQLALAESKPEDDYVFDQRYGMWFDPLSGLFWHNESGVWMEPHQVEPATMSAPPTKVQPLSLRGRAEHIKQVKAKKKAKAKAGGRR